MQYNLDFRVYAEVPTHETGTSSKIVEVARFMYFQEALDYITATLKRTDVKLWSKTIGVPKTSEYYKRKEYNRENWPCWKH